MDGVIYLSIVMVWILAQYYDFDLKAQFFYLLEEPVALSVTLSSDVKFRALKI